MDINSLKMLKPGRLLLDLCSMGTMSFQTQADESTYEYRHDGSFPTVTIYEKTGEKAYQQVAGFPARALGYAAARNIYIKGGSIDVISGIFNGCYMVKYRDPESENFRFSHIATGSGCQESTPAFFETYSEQSGLVSLCFKPGDSVTSARAKDLALERLGKIPNSMGVCGLITSEDQCFRIYVSTSPGDNINGRPLWVILDEPEEITGSVLMEFPVIFPFKNRQEWKKGTSGGIFRSSQLKAVDAALEKYLRDPSSTNKANLKTAYLAWAKANPAELNNKKRLEMGFMRKLETHLGLT